MLPGLPPGTALSDERRESIVQKLIQALWQRLHGIVTAFAPKQQGVGVENRFYFDEVEKVWKLQGGESEQERAESEAIRFHTSRGMANSLAPPTTACDASRGATSELLPPPPPPTSGPVCQPLHGGAASGPVSSAFSHPVYAPQGMSIGSAAPAQGNSSAPPPPGPPPSGQPLTSPFGATPSAPLTSPFGATPAAAKAPAAPLSSPFGITPPASAPTASGPAAAPLTSPFGGAAAGPAPAAPGPPAAPLAAPFGAAAAGPGQATPLAAPFSSPLATPFKSTVETS